MTQYYETPPSCSQPPHNLHIRRRLNCLASPLKLPAAASLLPIRTMILTGNAKPLPCDASSLLIAAKYLPADATALPTGASELPTAA